MIICLGQSSISMGPLRHSGGCSAGRNWCCGWPRCAFAFPISGFLLCVPLPKFLVARPTTRLEIYFNNFQKAAWGNAPEISGAWRDAVGAKPPIGSSHPIGA